MPTDLSRLAEIVEAAEDLVAGGGTQMSWETVQERMRPLIQEWRAIHEAADSPKVPLDEALWGRFRAMLLKVTHAIETAPQVRRDPADGPASLTRSGEIRIERERIISMLEGLDASLPDAYERFDFLRQRWRRFSKRRGPSEGMQTRFSGAVTGFLNRYADVVSAEIVAFPTGGEEGGVAAFDSLRKRIAALESQAAKRRRLQDRLDLTFEEYAEHRRPHLMRGLLTALAIKGDDARFVALAPALRKEWEPLPGGPDPEFTRHLDIAIMRAKRHLMLKAQAMVREGTALREEANLLRQQYRALGSAQPRARNDSYDNLVAGYLKELQPPRRGKDRT
jgi:hypothetical protein